MVTGSRGDTARPARRPATEAEWADTETTRDTLLEGIIAESEDEALLDRYLGGADLPLETLTTDLEIAVVRGAGTGVAWGIAIEVIRTGLQFVARIARCVAWGGGKATRCGDHRGLANFARRPMSFRRCLPVAL